MSHDTWSLIVKDPQSVNDAYGMDWSEYLEDLGASVTIASSEWIVSTITGDADPLVVASDEVLSGGLVTQVYLSGGTVGRRYTVTNRITTDSTPAVTDDRTFKVLIQQR